MLLIPYLCAQMHFFEGIEIQRGSAGIAFTCTPDGRPKGEAYVEFPSEDAQKEALKRHKNEIGDRYIELFVSSKANMIQVSSCTARCFCYDNQHPFRVSSGRTVVMNLSHCYCQ